MNPLEVFQKEAPEVAEAFNGLIEALKSTKGLDSKTKQLVYIGIKSAMGDTTAIYYHVAMAKKLSSLLCGVAGEYFVAAELSRRGYIASITLRNTLGVDIPEADYQKLSTLNAAVDYLSARLRVTS